MSGGLAGCDTYVVEGESTAVVDPGTEPSTVERFLDENGLSPDHVLLTHVHYDHSAAAPALREMGAEVCVHEAEADALETGGEVTLHDMFSSPPATCDVDRRLRDGDEVAGARVVHTPGHSPGSSCYVLEGSREALVGDLVFPGGSFGRTDLPGGSGERLAESLERAASLDLDGFYSGHGGRGPWSDVEKASLLAGSML